MVTQNHAGEVWKLEGGPRRPRLPTGNKRRRRRPEKTHEPLPGQRHIDWPEDSEPYSLNLTQNETADALTSAGRCPKQGT